MRLEPRAAIVAALVVCAGLVPQLALGDSHARSGARDWNEPAQIRRAYCAIRRWAAGAGFGNRRGVYANACN